MNLKITQRIWTINAWNICKNILHTHIHTSELWTELILILFVLKLWGFSVFPLQFLQHHQLGNISIFVHIKTPKASLKEYHVPVKWFTLSFPQEQSGLRSRGCLLSATLWILVQNTGWEVKNEKVFLLRTGTECLENASGSILMCTWLDNADFVISKHLLCFAALISYIHKHPPVLCSHPIWASGHLGIWASALF